MEEQSAPQLDVEKSISPTVIVPDEDTAVVASGAKQPEVAQQEPKSRRRSLPRARSFGAKVVPTTDALANGFDPTLAGGTAAAPAVNPKDPFNFNFGPNVGAGA